MNAECAKLVMGAIQREKARMVWLAVEAGVVQSRLAETTGYTRQRISQLAADGRRIVEEENADG